MDVRNTLAQDETFIVILEECFSKNIKASLIVDDSGLERNQGKITSINFDSKEPYLALDNGSIILLKSIIAVNGVFLPSYSEC
jgi:hypothetical protein